MEEMKRRQTRSSTNGQLRKTLLMAGDTIGELVKAFEDGNQETGPFSDFKGI